MARSIGFAAYRALSGRRSRPSSAIANPRPDGRVLWLHATSVGRLLALGELGVRIQDLRADLVVLITAEPDMAIPPLVEQKLSASGLRPERFRSDHPTEARQFLDHWKPDICLWAGALLMPNLISQAAERGTPMILIDVSPDDFPKRRHKWFPDLTRASLEQFETIMVDGRAAAAMLRRIGVPGPKITLSEPLRNGPSPLPIHEEDLIATSQQLTGRPLWLAVHVRADEFEPVLSAHRAAVRLVHRLLLVVIVADPDTRDRLADNLQGTGLRFVQWQIGDDIDDNTQVLITDGVDDLGLWYRMAPLTFMASSLTIGNTGRSPLEAVGLGSAVLFGPHVLGHRDAYSRLTSAGAGRAVGDAEGLGAAVIRLVAPDHAAAMALAGWQVVTEGAELTDQLIDLVQERLDGQDRSGGQGPDHARP